jgi:hypothetical protein
LWAKPERAVEPFDDLIQLSASALASKNSCRPHWHASERVEDEDRDWIAANSGPTFHPLDIRSGVSLDPDHAGLAD